ncbi:uncharacterized protein LOC117119762 isoform X2 [Anneissia japonica]|uniref:uncharacterized protein LOC117119762 isoform X2 n=1 Tax=Anneissia japonica TaxID=1529436 RepID=UPI0014256D2F|nr:uncharacterized protein LOC117119762 isoform X2 [Anneissia japonica]
MSKYIMVSFQSKYREIVRRIVDRLRKEGYIVWMDETDMENRIADDLANAIKDAEVVLVCLSSNYKDSVYCERESNNVAHFRKPFIVLMMERFTMDGWVANYYSERLYTDFSKEEMFETGFQNLLERLQRDHPHLATTNNPLPSNPGGASSTVSGAQSTAPSGYQTDRRQVAEASGDQNDGQQGN